MKTGSVPAGAEPYFFLFVIQSAYGFVGLILRTDIFVGFNKYV